MTTLAGSCLCGNVTYTCGGEPILTAICHCADCQKQTGSAFSIVVGVRRDQLHVRGDSLTSVTTTGTDTNLQAARQFCNRCGSPIASLSDATPDLALIKAGTLHDRSWLDPQLEVWCNSAQPWVQHNTQNRRCFRRGAPDS